MEQDALMEVWNQNYTKLFHNAASLLHDCVEAEDILQNAITKAWIHKDTIRAKQCCYAWLKTIVRNECLTFLRRTKRQIIVLMPLDLLVTIPARTIGIDSQCLELSIDSLVSGMPDKVHAVFHLYFQGYRTIEISELMHIPTGTVKSYMHKARSIARRNLLCLADDLG